MKPFFDVLLLPKIFLYSTLSLLASIVFALCLFGVSPATANNKLLTYLFVLVYSFAISGFLNGVYMVTHSFSKILEKSTEINIKQGLKLIGSIVERKLKDLEKESSKKEEIKHEKN